MPPVNGRGKLPRRRTIVKVVVVFATIIDTTPGPRYIPAMAPAPAPAPPPRSRGAAAAGLGDSRRQLLDAIKRLGRATLREAAADLGLARETVREHLNALGAEGLVERAGSRRGGPGRPEILYRLTRRAEGLFPRRDGEVLGELTAFLLAHGDEAALRAFYEQRAAARLAAARARLAGLSGRQRLAAVARVLSDEGYMADVVDGALRLAHCPIRSVVDVTHLPCRAELAFVERLLGRKLKRTDYLPDGGTSCSYRVARGK
jgi:predicted ArsR family transcriptional regulator